MRRSEYEAIYVKINLVRGSIHKPVQESDITGEHKIRTFRSLLW